MERSAASAWRRRVAWAAVLVAFVVGGVGSIAVVRSGLRPSEAGADLGWRDAQEVGHRLSEAGWTVVDSLPPCRGSGQPGSILLRRDGRPAPTVRSLAAQLRADGWSVERHDGPGDVTELHADRPSSAAEVDVHGGVTATEVDVTSPCPDGP